MFVSAAAVLAASSAFAESHTGGGGVDLGQRPAYLVDRLPDGELKDTLAACVGQPAERTTFSIGHRGAPLQFPEHTVESNRAAARQGAGVLECDVTFTKDKALVCRHAQDDLHTTTDILTTDLAATCATPFTPASGDTEASAECRTSDITLEEFRTLSPKMDSADATAETPEAYQGGGEPWRTTLYEDGATSMTHAESIALFDELGADFTPELKAPVVEMPFDGMTQQDYAMALVQEYRDAGIDPSRVWLQSFELDDIRTWIEQAPEFGAQAVYLMDEYDTEGYDPNDPATWPQTMAELKEMGVNVIAPPIWMLLTLEGGEMVPSALATEAKAAGLEMIAWSLERSGPLTDGGGWYYQSVSDQIDGAEDYLQVLDVLAQDVGVRGVFSDWPATVTFYANCMGL